MTARGRPGSSEPPARLIVSREAVLVDEAVDDLRSRLVPPEARDMNCLTVFGWEADTRKVVEFLQTMPFLAERRLLVLREVGDLREGRETPEGEERGGDPVDTLLSYLRDPNPASVLVMTSTALDPKKDATLRALGALSSLEVLEKPRASALPRWVQGRFQRLGKTIAPDLASTLVEVAGADLTALASETVKVALHAGEREAILAQDLEVSLAGSVQTVFTLLDAVSDRDAQRAFASLKALLEADTRPEQLVGMLARQFRMLARARALVEEGAEGREAARKVGIAYPGLQEKFARQVGRARMETLLGALAAIGRCDHRLKSGRLPEGLALDWLLVELLG